MHDIDRNSLFGEGKGSKKKHTRKSSEKHSHEKHKDDDHTAHHDHDEEIASKYPDFEHRHAHEDDDEHEHYNSHDHGYNHDEDEYHDHEYEDEHHHNHPKDTFTDRAFEHVHGHGHQLLHSHQHVHHQEEASVVHKWLKDPVRDWFALVAVGILIVLSKFGMVEGNLGRGFLVMASVIGLFPLVKNSVIRGLIEKKFNAEIGVSLVLIALIFYGKIFFVALAVFLILLGSFLRLNFSWNK